jgi:hypothetical protein
MRLTDSWRAAVVVLGALCLAVLLLGLLSCASAAPRVVATAPMGKGGSITLYAAPCGPAVQPLVNRALRPAYREGWQRADGVFFMTGLQALKAFKGCWWEPPGSVTGKRFVLLIWEDSDTMAIPCEAFGMCEPQPKPAGEREI